MGDEAEIAGAVAKGTTEGLMKPVTDLLGRLLAPAFDEIGEEFRVSVSRWRQKRAARFANRTIEFIEISGLPPQSVPPKLLLPAIEHASLEDDDALQDRWAALIANAAHPENAASIDVYFADILSQLSPHQARTLNCMYELAVAANERRVAEAQPPVSLTQINQGDEGHMRNVLPEPDQGLSRENDPLTLALENFLRLGLLERRPKPMRTGPPIKPGEEAATPKGAPDLAFTAWYYLTGVGVRFIKACRPPTSPTFHPGSPHNL